MTRPARKMKPAGELYYVDRVVFYIIGMVPNCLSIPSIKTRKHRGTYEYVQKN